MTDLETNFEELLFRDSFVQVLCCSHGLNSLKLFCTCPLMRRAGNTLFSKQRKAKPSPSARPGVWLHQLTSARKEGTAFPSPSLSLILSHVLPCAGSGACQVAQWANTTAERNHAQMWIILSTILGCIGSPKSPAKAGKREWGREVKRSKEREWDLAGMQCGMPVTRLTLLSLSLDNHLKFQLQP